MKAAKLTEHPSFRLMRQTDVQNVWHMQMPRWLFSDPRYADMSLDAKVAYTFEFYNGGFYICSIRVCAK